MKSIRFNSLLAATCSLFASAVAMADTYSYDGLNRLVSVVFASGGTQTYSYDAAGNLLGIRTTGGVVAPSVLTIAAVTGASNGGSVTSSAITVAGVNGTSAISVTGGEYRVNGGAWTSSAGVVRNGDVVNVRVTASNQPNTTVRATLTIGNTSGSFSVTTAAPTVMAFDDGTVTDPNTGLMWMRCAQGQTWSNGTCMGMESRYTFEQASALTNAVTFAGKSDWRLPNIRELQTIVDRTVTTPAIDRGVFPNASGSNFWSSSPYPYMGKAWYVYFNHGYMYADDRSNAFSVRLVRGGQSFGQMDLARPTEEYVVQGDGTVTHTPTGLMWQRCAVGQTWNGSTCAGTITAYTWDAAKLVPRSFAGKTDWRLPSEEELLTLVDYSKYSPAINASVFPNLSISGFWSDSPYVGTSGDAWYVHFNYGVAQYNSRNNTYGVRLVRAGQSFAPLPPTDINCVVSWAEARIPYLLTPPKGVTLTADTISYRAYSGGVYMGVEGSSNTILAVGGSLGPNVLTVGQLGDFLPTARNASCR